MGYHKKRARARGQGARSDPVEQRSQDVLQALASVRDHKSKSTMRPRRLVASCAQLQRCVARPCGTLHGKQQGRTAALRGRAGVQLLLPFDWVFFGFPLTLAISTPGMHIAPLGEAGLPPYPPEPRSWTCQ